MFYSQKLSVLGFLNAQCAASFGLELSKFGCFVGQIMAFTSYSRGVHPLCANRLKIVLCHGRSTTFGVDTTEFQSESGHLPGVITF